MDMMSDTLLIVIVSAPFVIAALFFLYKFLLQLSTKPVLEISLNPLDNPGWSNKEKIAELIDIFQKHGFDLAGHYECPEMPGLKISGFVKPSEQLVGVINNHPIAGIWEDVFVEYNDGESLTASNAPMGQEMDHMPQSTKIYMKGSLLEELIAKVLAERKNKARKTITKEEFSSKFEESYKKEMKWRMDRGGPTALEVKKVADEMGVPLDSSKTQAKTQQLRKIWMKEKSKPRKVKREVIEAELPGEFQSPDVFRQKLEKISSPMPQEMNIPVVPAYIFLIAAISYWLYFGFQYNKAHTVSLTAVVIFLAVFLFLFIALMWINIRHQATKMCPFLKRIGALRPGAFLFISGTFPALFYAKEGWLGKVVFDQGGEDPDACTRLEAITKRSGGWLSISKNNIISNIFGQSDKDNILIPDSDFGKKFTMSGSGKVLAEELLKSSFTNTMMRLDVFKKPSVEIDGKTVAVEIKVNLFSTRKETELRQFLEVAENIIDTVVQK
jgi:hypothetical protein